MLLRYVDSFTSRKSKKVNEKEVEAEPTVETTANEEIEVMKRLEQGPTEAERRKQKLVET